MEQPNQNLEHWQIRAKRIIEPVLLESESQELIEFVHELPHEKWAEAIKYMLTPVFGLPGNCFEFMFHYLGTNEQDYTRIGRAQVRVLAEIDETLGPSLTPELDYKLRLTERDLLNIPELYLIVDPWITRKELLNYIEKRFTKDIEPKLEVMRGGKLRRVKDKPKLERDIQLEKELRRGRSAEQIARKHEDEKINTAEDVRRAAHRRKKKL